MLESRIKNHVLKLKAIASIQAGDKWNTYTSMPQKPGLKTSLLRTFWYYSEDKKINIADIKNTITSAVNMLEELILMYSEDFDSTEQMYSLKLNINSALEGVNNLKVVYSYDATTVYEINNLIEEILARIKNIIEY